MRCADEHARMTLDQTRLRAHLVRGIGVAVDEHNRGCFDAELFETFVQRCQAGFIKRLRHFTVSADAFPELKPQSPFDQRLVLLKIQIVSFGPIDAADLIDGTKATGGNQRGPGAGALQNRVDGDGGAMQKKVRGGVVAAGPVDTRADAVDQPIWRCKRLAEGELACLVVKQRDVGESAADIGGKSHVWKSYIPSRIRGGCFHPGSHRLKARSWAPGVAAFLSASQNAENRDRFGSKGSGCLMDAIARDLAPVWMGGRGMGAGRSAGRRPHMTGTW